jgi:hypothetical protein
MTRPELDRALARATGETRRRIRRIGFTLVVTPTRPARERDPRATPNARVAPVG